MSRKEGTLRVIRSWLRVVRFRAGMGARRVLLPVLQRTGVKKTPPYYQVYRPELSMNLLDPLLIISHINEFAYFRIFKAANSTVVASLYHAECGKAVDSLEALQPIKDHHFIRPSQLSSHQVTAVQESYFKFTFVRNPYARVVAAYWDKVYPREQPKHRLVARFLGKPDEAGISFDEFITYLEDGGTRHNAHWARQCDLLGPFLDDVDYIGKTESLVKGLNYVLTTVFGSAQPIISVREHTTGSSAKLNNIGSAIRRRIRRLYESDFEVFGYRP